MENVLTEDKRTLKDSPDARFRFAMSKDGMKLGVSRYFPPNCGREPSAALIRKQLAEAGVDLPVDAAAADRVIKAIREGRPFTGITLVRGIPPQEPRHGSLIALGDLDYPVFPGDKFARYRRPKAARPGRTIDGRTLPAEKDFTPDDITVKAGDNVDWDPADDTFVSRAWGMARLAGGIIRVAPVARIADDRISVTGTLHHRDFQGRAVTPAKVEKELRDLGVAIDPDMNHLAARIRLARENGRPLADEILVEGSYPVPGRNGWLEYLVSTRKAAGMEKNCGRMDFRDRGVHPMVKPGQAIVRYHHPTGGEGGIDIYGKTIPPHAGCEAPVTLGENVALLDDGVTYQARAEGVVTVDRDRISVSKCLVIPGNVDYNSGNVTVERGSVKVAGSIQAGFSVSAPVHVIVEGAIESATVTAGGMVTAGGGILMPDGGQISAGGDVMANFAVNADIRAGGDVTIANEISNSTIHCRGRLVAVSGKGAIHGGRIVTRKGAVVNEIGSELGVKTVICVDTDHPEDEALREQRAKITQSIRKIDAALGTDPPELILLRTPDAKRRAVAEVLGHRATLAKQRRSITDQIRRLSDARRREMEEVTITARVEVHPGVTVRFGKVFRHIARRCRSPILYWDFASRDIGIR
ncbi:MAG: DUF342 domain-containing protein [Desulfovibrionaceae bacterium]|nr:DUF342 domain-containing protein [Desulfovibrionaceae bacterium]